MRADRELTYRIDRLPEVPEALAFLVAESGLDPRDAYATFNMGAGFAIFVAAGAADGAVAAARAAGYRALVAGRVEAGPRQVLLEPLGVSYLGEDLEVR
jgi:phosphoribosylformylglycinamidine cyclo-ligase